MGNGKCGRQSCLYLSTSHVRTYKKKELSLALREKIDQKTAKTEKGERFQYKESPLASSILTEIEETAFPWEI